MILNPSIWKSCLFPFVYLIIHLHISIRMPGYLPYTLGYNPILSYFLAQIVPAWTISDDAHDPLTYYHQCVCVCVFLKFIYYLLNFWSPLVACEILSFPTRDWIHTLCSEGGVSTTGPPRKSGLCFFDHILAFWHFKVLQVLLVS